MDYRATCVCMHVCTYTYIHICVCIYVYICVCVYVYVCANSNTIRLKEICQDLFWGGNHVSVNNHISVRHEICKDKQTLNE